MYPVFSVEPPSSPISKPDVLAVFVYLKYPPLLFDKLTAETPSNVSAEPVASALELEAYITPFAVNEVRPVPPLVVASVPARVTAPDVAEEGVKPVVPALKVVTATPDKVDHWGAVPEEVRICPFVPIPNLLRAVPVA